MCLTDCQVSSGEALIIKALGVSELSHLLSLQIVFEFLTVERVPKQDLVLREGARFQPVSLVLRCFIFFSTDRIFAAP